MTTKDNIIEQALRLFSAKGFEAVSVRDIARAVGIKESSLYYHFKTSRIFSTPLSIPVFKRPMSISAGSRFPLKMGTIFPCTAESIRIRSPG